MTDTTPTDTSTEEMTEEMPEGSPSGEKEEKKKPTRRPHKEKPPKEPRVKKWADDHNAHSKGTIKRNSRRIPCVRLARRNSQAYVLKSTIRSIARVVS